VRRYREYADGAAGRLAGIAAMAPTVTALPPPPAPAGDGSDEEGGNALTGLGKGFEDLWNEGKGLVTGTVHHVNVFDQDQWQDTWSNDWDIANAIYDDPLGSGEAVLSGMWAPIAESYEHGGVDEATARAIPSIAGTILGGKGLTKLKNLEHAGDAAPSPSDTPKVIPGGEAPDGSFIPDVLDGDQLPLTARPTPGQDVTRLYGQPGDGRGLVPMEPHEYARPGGRSYTPERLEDMANPRDHLGLPDVNSGRFVIHGQLVDVKDVLVRHALPLDGTRGGAIEYLIPDPAGQVRVVQVEGVNPPP
jgi:hypothetical protein